jgi:thermostable 8-oxoguanine DNA glycosylase
MTNNMLNAEERKHKDEIIKLTEDVLDARGIECDSRISRLPLDELEEILEEVRRRYKKKNKKAITEKASSSSSNTEEVVEEEIQYIR